MDLPHWTYMWYVMQHKHTVLIDFLFIYVLTNLLNAILCMHVFFRTRCIPENWITEIRKCGEGSEFSWGTTMEDSSCPSINHVRMNKVLLHSLHCWFFVKCEVKSVRLGNSPWCCLHFCLLHVHAKLNKSWLHSFTLDHSLLNVTGYPDVWESVNTCISGPIA